jgi:hypothetical protein
MRTLMVALLACYASAQTPQSQAGFRLGYVRNVYVESLGQGDAAKVVRDQVIGAILNRTGLVIEAERSTADAALFGTAVVTSGQMHWAVGSLSSRSAAVASASQSGASAAAVAASNARFSAGGGTIRITELGLQLKDLDDRILWAFDGTRCLDTTALLLLGAPKNKPVTVCATEQLVKAIDRDAKSAKSGDKPRR